MAMERPNHREGGGGYVVMDSRTGMAAAAKTDHGL
jgi:hypothetical protein